MRQRPKSLKSKAKLAVAAKSPKNQSSKVRDLEKRLAEALRDKAEALKREAEALEQQTATGEILRTIAQAPTDIQPVFDAVAANAARLCGVDDVTIHRIEDGRLRRVAHVGSVPVLADSRIPLLPGGVNERVLSERRTIHISDTHAPSFVCQFPGSQHAALGTRSLLATPLVREGVAIGLIQLRRVESRPFTDRQIALLETFADQAVIAIENVRLFKELEERNRDLTATSELLRVISRSPADAQPVFDAIVDSAARLTGAQIAAVLRFDGELYHWLAGFSPVAGADEVYKRAFPRPLEPDVPSARAIRERRVIRIPDIELDNTIPDGARQRLRRAGVRSNVQIPMLRDDVAIGVIAVSRTQPIPFTDRQVALLQTFADQAVIAIENVRLFKEIEEKSHQLEVASQHKSEFLANMSHELRTPLNAIIGFSEVLSERMFGELNEKQEEYSKDIYASGQHLLSLINDILDLSKIEAGRMELELTAFDLPNAIENALMLVRERAGRRSIALDTNIDTQLGQIQADERKVRQVVLNLLSNAIKFTPEGGRIEVGAVPRDGSVEVSVSDTGVGIAPEDQEAVFEEFRQVGTAEKKAEGTGLGLTLCRKFIELHGGRIWVTSQVGVGSTFTFTIPVRVRNAVNTK